MNFKPMAAFGNVVVVCTADAGDYREVALDSNGVTSSGNYFYTKGSVAVEVKETGEKLQDRTAGWLNTEHPNSGAATTGTLALTFNEPTNWLCIPHNLNTNGLPDVSSLSLDPAASLSLTEGTNLFLVQGTLTIKSRQFIAPMQVRVRSSDTTATNLTTSTVYGLIFK
jgi:hypothetical protein